MNRIRCKGLWLAVALAVAQVIAPTAASAAETLAIPGLPPLSQVTVAINSHPAVAGARAGINLEQANRKRLNAGPHETMLRFGTLSRHDALTNRNLQEWDVMVERPLRWGGKGALDSQLGEQGVDQAKLAVGDARHEAGRSLLRMWFGWLRAAVQTGHWQEQQALLARQAGLVARRAELGDAPRQEQSLAAAAVAQAQYALLQAGMRKEVAASELTNTFPQIKLPPNPPLVEPVPVAQGLEFWQARIAEQNHELAIARGEVKRRETLAQRARADRTPDPAIGVRYGSERAGTERVIGLVLSISFSGALRQAGTEAALAQTDIAVQRQAAVQRRLGAEAAATFSGAQRSFDSWRQARVAADAMERNAALSARAYQLGESSLSELLAAQRLAIEARLAAAVVQLDAAEARYRLLLDAHLLWDMDDD